MDKAKFVVGFEAAVIVAVVLPGFISVMYGLFDGSLSLRFAFVFLASIVAAILGVFLLVHGIAIGSLFAGIGWIATIQCVGKMLSPTVANTRRAPRK